MQDTVHKYYLPDGKKSKKLDVLILDDNVFDRKRMRRALDKTSVDMNIAEVSSLETLKDIMGENAFDLILVDYALTDGDGIQALEMIKHNQLNQNANTVMVTGNDSSTLAVQALKLGFSDYMNKEELCAASLSNLITALKARLNDNVVKFPFETKRKPEVSEKSAPNTEISSAIQQMLQPAIEQALQQALTHLNHSENLSEFLAGFEDKDEFLFI